MKKDDIKKRKFESESDEYTSQFRKKKVEGDGSDFDFVSISRGIFILGIVILITWILYFIASTNTPEENISEDEFRGPNVIVCAIPIAVILIGLGVFLFFINRGFLGLVEFAEEVESGEFEKKVLKELEDD